MTSSCTPLSGVELLRMCAHHRRRTCRLSGSLSAAAKYVRACCLWHPLTLLATVIDVGGCELVTIGCVSALVGGCTRLRSINIDGTAGAAEPADVLSDLRDAYPRVQIVS